MFVPDKTFQRLRDGSSTLVWVPRRKGQYMVDGAVCNNGRLVFVPGRSYKVKAGVKIRVVGIDPQLSFSRIDDADAVAAGFDSSVEAVQCYRTKYGLFTVNRPCWRLEVSL
jgi:hypothetical protein